MGARREIDLTKFMYEQPPHYTVREMFIDYSRERLIAKGKDCLHAWSGFYYVAYYTGHRSRAIEELTWDRVDFANRKIDFNVPGRILTNKRRASDFPIPDDFLPRLLAWKERATDDYVIGLGPKGALSCTYREADYVVRELCGLTDPTLVPRHCMRKMYATECFEREMNPEVVGWLMGDDPDTLRKNYVTFKHTTLLSAANLRTREIKPKLEVEPA